MKKALTIAGSDSGGGAGIQQDLRVFSSLKVYGSSVITVVTAQNTVGIQGTRVLPLDLISAQIDSVMRDIPPDAVKTGMLADPEIIGLIYEKLRGCDADLVVDPVMVSSSGDRLLGDDSVDVLRNLISIAKLTTPNIHEAEVLSGIKIRTEEDMEKSAKKIGNCIVTGGHLNGIDVLHYEGGIHYFEGRGKLGGVFHGTGCAFSAAVTAYLARDLDVVEAVGNAKDFMDRVIGRAFSVGSGLSVLDTGGLRLGRVFVDKERNAVVGEIERAVERFMASRCSYRLMPEVGVNIVMALPGAKVIGEVAGVSGRLVRDRNKVVPVGDIDFGSSSHMARVVLTAMKSDPENRAALNICFSEEILSVCEKLNLSIGGFERGKQPGDTTTMEWGVSEAIKKSGGIPDIIYDRGAVGKEAMIRILGKNAGEVVDIALRIGGLLR
ncbi:MAG: bifunctional hydroxymethylpyrimidine kinase/phosphomethylpyrimidine kinase [Candidatus Altiarchaeota archaeon]|nr:bifunctional hydroxymethylpyrimidine kinase/phosphomethylpyrimidine kinase [Candidatus Altiarchaeota archaeon]